MIRSMVRFVVTIALALALLLVVAVTNRALAGPICGTGYHVWRGHELTGTTYRVGSAICESNQKTRGVPAGEWTLT